MLVQVRWHQGQQTCAGAYKIKSRFFGEGKREIRQKTCAGAGIVASGPTNLCWYRFCGSRASKLALVHTEFNDAFLEVGK